MAGSRTISFMASVAANQHQTPQMQSNFDKVVHLKRYIALQEREPSANSGGLSRKSNIHHPQIFLKLARPRPK